MSALKRIEEKHERYAHEICLVSSEKPCDVVKLARTLDEITTDYEGVLTTLGASRSSWARWICRNSKAHLEKIAPRRTLEEVAGG